MQRGGFDCGQRALAARSVNQTRIEGVIRAASQNLQKVNCARVFPRQRDQSFLRLEKNEVHAAFVFVATSLRKANSTDKSLECMDTRAMRPRNAAKILRRTKRKSSETTAVSLTEAMHAENCRLTPSGRSLV